MKCTRREELFVIFTFHSILVFTLTTLVRGYFFLVFFTLICEIFKVKPSYCVCCMTAALVTKAVKTSPGHMRQSEKTQLLRWIKFLGCDQTIFYVFLLQFFQVLKQLRSRILSSCSAVKLRPSPHQRWGE